MTNPPRHTGGRKTTHTGLKVGCLLLFVAVLIPLMAGEAVIRVIAAEKHKDMEEKYPYMEKCTMQARDKSLIYTYIPNQCGTNSQGYFDS